MSFRLLPVFVLMSSMNAMAGNVTVDQVVQSVLLNNPELQQAQARVQEQEGLIRKVKGGWLPKVTGGYSAGRNPMGMNTNTFEVGVSQAIYNPVLKRAVRSAEAAKTATMKSIESLQLFYIYRTHLAFYRVAKARQAIVIREKQLASLKAILKDAETRSRIGIEDEEAFATTLGDTSDVEVRLETDRQEAEVACQELKGLVGMIESPSPGDGFQAQVCDNLKAPDLIQFVDTKTENARARLSKGQPMTVALEVVGDIEVWGNDWLRSKLPDTSNPTATLLEVAVANRPDRFEALSLILSKEEDAKGARAAYQPTVSVGANAGYSNDSGRTGQFGQLANGGGSTTYGRFQSVDVRVQGTIFDGTRKGNISAADARLLQQQKNLLRVENQIRLDVENAVTRVKASTRILPPALKSYVAAQKALLIRSGKARLGTETGIVFQNLLLQQNLKVMERELTLFQSIVNVLEQEAQLKYATATF